jgi:hypothetical protein
MNISFEQLINRYIDNEQFVNQLIVTAFVKANNIEVNQNKLVRDLMLPTSNIHYLDIISYSQNFTFEDLIEAFEVAIPSKDQQTNGAVYTPKIIKDFIINQTTQDIGQSLDDIIGADVACGCGAFLYSLALKIYETKQDDIISIIENQLFGLDISESSIQRAKILLSLLALSRGEDKAKIKLNLFTGNALDFDWTTVKQVKKKQGFDIIVGNPPYVRAKNLDPESKKLLKNWQVTKTGNSDLYIPFFEIGYENLNKNGVLGYITVNTFYRSVNARSLRIYLEKNKIQTSIIDFGHEQIFENKLTYTCLCFISKTKSETIQFAKATLKNLYHIKPKDFTTISYDSLNSHRGWLLNNSKTISNIQKIENCGPSLNDLYIIRNGIATLSNNTYIFKPENEDDKYYYFQKDGQEYKIEKGISRNIIKPNILKYEHEIPKLKEKLIYPYINGISPLTLMKEPYFRDNFPNAYAYLTNYKERLSQRDKGKGDYGAWYAYGRTQALTDKGLKLLFPYMSKHPHFVFTKEKDMLIYCGYAIFSDSEKELLILKKLLESEVFDYYMRNTSKPYASGYYSYAKNYVKYFGVCELSENEKEEVLRLKKDEEVNQFFIDKYEVNI